MTSFERGATVTGERLTASGRSGVNAAPATCARFPATFVRANEDGVLLSASSMARSVPSLEYPQLKGDL